MTNKLNVLATIYGLLAQASLSNLFSSEVNEVADKVRATGDRSHFNKLKITEVSNYERSANATLAGTVNLLSQSGVVVDGVSTFAHRALSEDTVLTGMKLLIVKAEAAVGIPSAAYSFKQGGFATAILNADLVIRYNNGQIIKLPVRDLTYDGTEKRDIESTYGFDFVQPQVIKAGVPMTVELVMPAGVTAAAGGTENFYIEIQFKGSNIVVRTA
jgi:hypothetical protein